MMTFKTMNLRPRPPAPGKKSKRGGHLDWRSPRGALLSTLLVLVSMGVSWHALPPTALGDCHYFGGCVCYDESGNIITCPWGDASPVSDYGGGYGYGYGGCAASSAYDTYTDPGIAMGRTLNEQGLDAFDRRSDPLQLEMAIAFYRQALTYENHSVYRNNLAEALNSKAVRLHEAGDWDAAVRYYEEALLWANDSYARIRENVAWTLEDAAYYYYSDQYGVWDFETAARYVEKGLRYAPGGSEIQQRLLQIGEWVEEELSWKRREQEWEDHRARLEQQDTLSATGAASPTALVHADASVVDLRDIDPDALVVDPTKVRGGDEKAADHASAVELPQEEDLALLFVQPQSGWDIDPVLLAVVFRDTLDDSIRRDEIERLNRTTLSLLLGDLLDQAIRRDEQEALDRAVAEMMAGVTSEALAAGAGRSDPLVDLFARLADELSYEDLLDDSETETGDLGLDVFPPERVARAFSNNRGGDYDKVDVMLYALHYANLMERAYVGWGGDEKWEASIRFLETLAPESSAADAALTELVQVRALYKQGHIRLAE